MKKTQILAARFREVILDGTWIANTNFKDQLSGMHWEIAISEKYGFNSIASLTQHIHYYVRGMLPVLSGGKLEISDRYSFDFPPLRSQEQWETVLAGFWKDAARFAEQVELLPEEKLKDHFGDLRYGTFERNIDGLIEHSYYHLGQLVLIKKMLTQNV